MFRWRRPVLGIVAVTWRRCVMGDGHFGGDGSVAWEVNADHVREHHDDPDPHGNPNGRQQKGIDDTEDVAGSFNIEIKLPDDPVEQTKFLKFFTSEAIQGGKIKFSLPIEGDATRKQPKQVKIFWKSRGGVMRSGDEIPIQTRSDEDNAKSKA
jgi:hypothetical protein